MQPLDLISAAPWQRVVFSTYALSLSFFEAVVLDRLVRGGGRNALILSDPEGIRAGLSEQGARRAGRDYELEPVASTTGVFHPKLTLLFGDDDAHMLVGSGNLTFGGWGMNLETIDHLHPSFAAETFDDAADLFETLAIADNIRTGVADQFEPIASQLRAAARDAPRTGDFRLLHSMGTPIAQRLAELAEDLGGVVQITVVSPYFDKTGSALSKLSDLLKCQDLRVHAHPAGPVRGSMGINWPDAAIAAPVCVDHPFGDDSRLLHAKCFEILCQRGRLLVSGSANATNAALFAGNVEVSLVRIQRNVLVGWEATPADAPPIYPASETDQEDAAEQRTGILRAVLEGDRVVGQVITPRMRGSARLSVATTAGYVDLGDVNIADDSTFEASAPGLEMQSWGGGRLVLRIEQNANAAEGFVSVAAAAKIIQRAGAMAPRLLAMLSGTETPEDVAAILTWFKEDTNRIASAIPGTSSAGGKRDREAVWVSVEDLRTAGVFYASGGSSQHSTEPAWHRALWLVRSAFSQPRGPWKSDAGEDDQAEEEELVENESSRLKRVQQEERARIGAMNALDGLLDEMLADRHQGHHAASAFALAHYLADRLRPAPSVVVGWLLRVLGEFSRLRLPMDAPVATAGLLLRASDGQDHATLRARAFLIRAGVDPAEFAPEIESIPGFVAVLKLAWDAEHFIDEVRAVQTPGEEVALFLEAADNGRPLPPLPTLEASTYWPQLKAAYADEQTRARIQVLDRCQPACPRCNIVLPTASQDELRANGVTRHCRLILCKEI
jgi:hypothetical protein